MITRPLIKYAGSKWLHSGHCPPPIHDTIIEPFAGSAPYATRHADRRVILIEKDPEIAELWTWLISASEASILALPTDLRPGQDIRQLDIPRGGQLLIRQWQRVGMSNCWTVSKWNGVNTGFWHVETRAAVARHVSQIRHWQVVCADYTAAPSIVATWFIDSPYQSLPLYGSRLIDYRALGAWVMERQGQVIACELQGAAWLPFQPFREIVTGRRNGRYSREAIYLAGQI